MLKLGTSNGKSFNIDLDKLITSRLLVQAASGGGKSYLLRKLAEVAGDQVQIIILDPEGEFSTLRTHLDMVIVSAEDDIKPDPNSAMVLARRIMENKVSVVCDLYELDPVDRRLFVSRFLNSLMGLPRKYWRPTLVMLDEAHVYCPERGKATSTDAVNRLMSQGRKRGYCGILATQRLSKLDKDAAAECGTFFIGRTSPVDQERAADILGIKRSERGVFARLDNEFMGFGPALTSGEVVKFKAGKVVTQHPEAGKSHKSVSPAPSRAIKKVIQELSDLARSDDKPLTIDEAESTIASLKKQIKRNARSAPTADPSVINRAVEQAVNKERKAAEKTINDVKRHATKHVDVLHGKLNDIAKIAGNGSAKTRIEFSDYKHTPPIPTSCITQPKSATTFESASDHSDHGDAPKITGGALRMVQTLADREPAKFSLREWATLSKMSHKSGSFGTYRSTLKREGLFETDGRLFWASEKAIDLYGDPTRAPSTPEELLADWKNKIGGGGVSRMLDALVNAYPGSLSRKELGDEANLSSISGSFGTYLSKLRSNNLINEHDGHFSVAEILISEQL